MSLFARVEREGFFYIEGINERIMNDNSVTSVFDKKGK